MHNDLVMRNNVVGYDTETTGLTPYGSFKRWGHYPARPFAFGFYDCEGNSAYFRLEVDPKTRQVIPDKRVMREVGLITGNKKIRKVGHNLHYDIRMTEFSGIPFHGPIDDTLFMAHIATGGCEPTYAAKPLAVKYLDLANDDEEELDKATKSARLKAKKLGWCIATKETSGKKDSAFKADYWLAPPEMVEKYCVRDCERAILLWMLFGEEINKDENLLRTYNKEIQLSWYVKRMEERGVRYFPEDAQRLREFYRAYMAKWKKEADRLGGKGLNFNSPVQMRKKFLEEKGYEPKDYTDAGNGKVDGEFLQIVANKGDQLARAILEYKGGEHAIKDFLDQYDAKKVEESDGVWILHPNYRQVGPRTGRFSCGDPNLMQVAAPDGGRKRADITLRPRETMGPRDGYAWYLPDYSQIEVWLFAYLSGEEHMIKALHSGQDFHGSIAEKVWGEFKDYEEEKKHYRKRGKLLMFCKVYGGGAKAVADLLGCSVEEAQKFINDYEKGLPGVRPFIKRMAVRAERDGHIYNPPGRKFIIDQNFNYKAVNYLIQGTAADILKEAMIEVFKLLDARWPGCMPLLTIHDELVIEVPLKYHSKRLMREICRSMQGDFNKYIGCKTKLPVSMKYTLNRWSDAKEIAL